jgi:hypothetical protein
MWNLADSIRRTRPFVIGAAILSVLPLAQGADVVHVKREGLSMVTGRTVGIALPGGVITGKATSVEADALVVDVQKTSDPNAYPKGMLRAPRENLHRIEMQTKGKTGRAVLTTLGALAGVGGGAAALASYNHCLPLFGPCSQKHSVGIGAAAFVGVAAAGVAVGYFAGNGLDQHWTAIEILP